MYSPDQCKMQMLYTSMQMLSLYLDLLILALFCVSSQQRALWSIWKQGAMWRAQMNYCTTLCAPNYTCGLCIYRIVRIISPWCIISPPPSSAQSSCIGRLYVVIRIISPWCIISPPPVQSWCKKIAHGLIIRTTCIWYATAGLQTFNPFLNRWSTFQVGQPT